jgi:putative transposase
MRHVNGLYTQRFNRAHRRDGPVFRGRYKAIVIEAEAYLASVIRYIHLNPVKAKLVKSPETFQWSSHAQYLTPRSAPAWLAVRQVLDRIGSPRVFHEFVLSGNEEALEAFYAGDRQVPVLGSDRFGSWVRKKVRPLSSEHPRYERVKVRPSIRQVLQGVAAAFQVKVAMLQTSRRGEANEARKVAMYLVKRLCDLTLPETAREFGVTSYGAVGWACAQVRDKQANDPQFKQRVEEIERLFSQPKI